MLHRIGLRAVLSVGLVTLVAACGSGLPGSTSLGGTRSASPAPTSSPVPPAWSTLAWSPKVGMPDGWFLSDLIRSGSGYVGVGGIDSGTNLDAAFFTSMDGTHWSLAARHATSERNVYAARVVKVGGRLIAVGQAVLDGPGETPDSSPPLWLSNDGREWSPLTSPTWDESFPTTWPAWLLAGPREVVAVSPGADPVIASSRDGSAWTVASVPSTERAIVNAAVGWSGGFVIVGRDGQPDRFSAGPAGTDQPPGAGLPAAWTSEDGAQWSEAEVDGNRVPGAELRYAVPVRAGLLGVGIYSTAGFYAQAFSSWTSSDGSDWSIATDWKCPFVVGGYPTFATDGREALVFGPGRTSPALAAWVTTDGTTWLPLAETSVDDAPPIECAGKVDCVRIDQAWLVPDGVIVAGTSVAGNGQALWKATLGS